MRSTRSITLILATMLLSPTVLHNPVFAQQTLPSISPVTEDPKTAALRKEIQGYYDGMDAATGRLNINDAFKYIAPDCKIIMRDGKKITLKALKENWEMLYRRSLKSNIKTEITQFSTKGDTATVETRSLAMLRFRNDNGIETDFEANILSRDFWMKTKGVWRIKQTRESDRTIKINGQTIQE